MAFSDLLDKLGNGEKLNANELSQLRDETRAIEEIKNLAKGWVNIGTSTPIFQPPMEVIYSQALGNDTASHTIHLPNKYKHLLITGVGRTTATPANPQGQSLNFTFDSDTGTNYAWSDVYGNSTGAGGAANDTQSNLPFGMFNTDNCAAGSASSFFTFIPHYTGPFWKSCLSIIQMQRVSGVATGESILMTGFWKNTSQIYEITVVPGGGLGGSLKAGAVFSVYGLL